MVNQAQTLLMVFNIIWDDGIFHQAMVLACEMLGCVELMLQQGITP